MSASSIGVTEVKTGNVSFKRTSSMKGSYILNTDFSDIRVYFVSKNFPP